MALPIFEDFLYPFLCQLKDKEVSKQEIKQSLIKHFNLSDEDCMLMTKGGTSSQINDRIGWVLQY